MKYKKLFLILCALALAHTAIAGTAADADWPQWRGPDRTGISKETGLLKSWPASGPTVVWTVSNLGEGYGSISIKDNRVFVQGVKGSDSVVYCLNRADGKVVWTKVLGPK